MKTNNTIQNILLSLSQLNDEQLGYIYTELKNLYDRRVINKALSVELTREELTMLLQRDL